MNDVAADQEIVKSSSEVSEQQKQHQENTTQRRNSHQGSSYEKSPGDKTPIDTVTHHWPEEDKTLALPTRWWYAQTAFPLCAGTFGPMANAFSICALVENWRVEVPPGGREADGTAIKDPKWLIIVNAISLACALIANMSLLLNMARRLSFSTAQSITIVGFWTSSVLLIGLIARASHHFLANESQALTQAYYYACWAAGLYQIISYLMCFTVYGALKEKYPRDFQLTTAQRTLMLQTISFLAYLLIGALIFSRVEGWQYLDAVYWADFTLLTIGIGDYAPTTHTGRSLLFPFAVGGIVVLGLVVSSIRSMILDRGKAKHSARMTEKIRRKVVQRINALRSGERKGSRLGRNVDRLERMKQVASGPNDSREDELKRRETEFGIMRKVQDYSEQRQKWMNLFVSGSAWAMLWFFGALIFTYTERNEQHWSYFLSVYFAYTSLLTIGYGDYSPTSNCGKAFFVFWSLLAIPSLTILISDMSDTIVRFVRDITIWLGEVTILPSNETSIQESLEHGFSKATLNLSNKLRRAKSRATKDAAALDAAKNANDSTSDPDPDADADQTDRIAENFEQVEREEEYDARKRHDWSAEEGHRYRRTLISQIRKLYADSRLSQPKKYTYNEWNYFLKLLGQDEGSSDLHILAPVKTHKQSEGPRQWSWIGPRSPLMSNKHEPALLLELFFERLEESLREMYDKNAKSTS